MAYERLTHFKATMVRTGVMYEGDAAGLIELLIEDGHSPKGARMLVKTIQRRRVLIINGLILAAVFPAPDEAVTPRTP